MLNQPTVQDVREAKEYARTLYERAKAQADAENGRPFTESEASNIQRALDHAQALEKKLGAGRSTAAFTAEIEKLTKGMLPTRGGAVRGHSLGAQFARASSDWLREPGNRGTHPWASPLIELTDPRWGGDISATTITSDPTTGGVGVPPMYLPGITALPLRPAVVADLLGSGATASNAVVYMVETAYTNAADAVAEGGVKSESAITFTQRTDHVVKIAHYIPVTDELLEDEPGMAAYIDTRLTAGVQVKEDDSLLNGDGVAPHMLGLLNRPGLAPAVARVDPVTNEDAIASQIANIRATTFLSPTAIIIHPTNWETIVLRKTTYGAYIGASPFMTPTGPNLWGLPVAVSPVITAGTALVVTRSAATVFRRGGMNVQATNSHQDWFTKNLTAIRAEQRSALCVFLPAAIGKVTGLN